MSDWRERIHAVAPAPRVEAAIFQRPVEGRAQPVLVVGADDRDYLCKGPAGPGRSRIAESLAGVLGAAIGAPTAEVAFVRFSEELVSSERELSHFPAGCIAHGSVWIPGCSDAEPVSYERQPGNRERLLRLNVLYSWLGAGDRQLIYKKDSSRLVYSVDHGEFLGGPEWTRETLAAAGEPELVDPMFVTMGFSKAELADGFALLELVDEDTIANAVGRLPKWGIGLDERVALAEYLHSRKLSLQLRAEE